MESAPAVSQGHDGKGLQGSVAGGKPKSRLLAMKNKLRQKQKEQASLKSETTTSDSSTYRSQTNGIPTSKSNDNTISRSRPPVHRYGLQTDKSQGRIPPGKARSRTLDTCLTENLTQNHLETQDREVSSNVKRSQSIDVEVAGMKKFIRRDHTFRDGPTKVAKGSYLNMGPKPLRGKENMYTRTSTLPLPPKSASMRRGSDGDHTRHLSQGRVIAPQGRASARERAQGSSIAMKRSASVDETGLNLQQVQGQNRGQGRVSRVPSSKASTLYKVPIQRSLDSVRPADCMGSKTSSLPHDYHHSRDAYPAPPAPYQGKEPCYPASYSHINTLYSSTDQNYRAEQSLYNDLKNTKRFSRSLDDLTSDKNPAETSKLSAESDPIGNNTDHALDRETYLQEWAIPKPKSVLMSSRENLPSLEEPAPKKDKPHRFFFLRKGDKKKQPRNLQRSQTLDTRDSAAMREPKFHGSDPNLYIHDPSDGMRGSTENLKGAGSLRAFSLNKLNRGRKPKPGVKSQGGKSKTNLKVTNPEDIKYQRNSTDGSTDGGYDAAMPRRHTVTVGGIHTDDRKPSQLDIEKAAFLEHLAKKYPYHADTIKSSQERPPQHAVDPNRRRTTQVNQRPPEPNSSRPRAIPGQPEGRVAVPGPGEGQGGDGSPTGTFLRGGRLRSSLPVVRSPNKSLERPMGLIFLTFRNETKRALLPNEVTSLDTVKALFVRSFADTLSMQWFEIPGHKVYILDQNTNVYYELDDVRDVKDRAVLKVYETDHPHGPPPSPGPHSPQNPDFHTIHCHHATAGYESDSSVRSAPTGSAGVRSPLHHPPLSPRLYAHHQAPAKSQAVHIPQQNTYACPQQLKAAYATMTYAQAQHPHGPHPQGAPPSTHHAASSHWSPTSLRAQQQPPQGGQYLHPSRSNQSSPQRAQHAGSQAVPANQRHSLAYLPETTVYQDGRMTQSRSYHDYHEGGSTHTSGSATPTHNEAESKKRMDQMENQLANLAAWVQTTVMKSQSEAGSRPGSARSNSSVVSEGSYSAKSKTDSTTPLQSPTSSNQQGMSDVSSATPQPIISAEVHNNIRSLHHRARDLKAEVNKLRRLQVTNMETMRETIRETYNKLKDVFETIPSAQYQPLRTQRCQVDSKMMEFRGETERVQKDLVDLETSVEELRNDVLSRKCRVNISEIENMALALSTITKALGDLKANFPVLQEDMKSVMQGEMQVVVTEEKFLREEPEKLDAGLKRCKKVTGTLATMRRLALVQENKTPHPPSLVIATPKQEDRMAVLDNIKALVPNHEARFSSVQAAEDARERKKKIDTKSESLRFEKSLAMAQKQLKEPGPAKGKERPQNGLKTLTEEQETEGLQEAGTSPETRINGHANNKIMGDVYKAGTVGPQKPPRVVSPDKNGPSALVFGINGDSFHSDTGNKGEEPAGGAGSRLSTFEASISSGVMASPGPSIMLNTHPPLSPTSTSTPKSQGHVTFNSAITEISVNSSTTSTPGQKKIPPPPPPRKSSRTSIMTPSPSPRSPPATVERPPSPHMYENIDKLNIVPNNANDSSKDREPNVSDRLPAQRPKSTSDLPTSDSANMDRPKSQDSPNKGKPMNKFQLDLAAGIYSNMNRPDLQHQKVHPARVVQDSPVHSPDTPSSNSSSSTSLDSQLGGGTGTIKRNKNYTAPNEQNNTGNTSPTEKGRKIPPPPPQRKTSTLSQAQQIKAKEAAESAKSNPTSPPKSRLQAQYDKFKQIQKEACTKPVANGGIHGPPGQKHNLIPNGDAKKTAKDKGSISPRTFEETDIY